MINEKDEPVAWALLIAELDEAREHLESLTAQLAQEGAMDEDEFAVYLGHVYAHLNRVWHSRNQSGLIEDEQWDLFSQFPVDLRPVG